MGTMATAAQQGSKDGRKDREGRKDVRTANRPAPRRL
jgi:hypothetical protein